MHQPLTSDDQLSYTQHSVYSQTHTPPIDPHTHQPTHPVPHSSLDHPPPHPPHPVATRPRTSSHPSPDPPPPSRPSPPLCTFLHFLLFIRVISSLALLALSALTLEMIHQTLTHRPASTPPDFFTAILALIFHFLTALLLILAHLRLHFVLSQIPLLSSFIFLGLAQCYLAVLVLSNATVEGRFDAWLVGVMRGVCGGLFGVGLGFVVLGCVGGKGMEKRRKAEQRERRRRQSRGESDDDDYA